MGIDGSVGVPVVAVPYGFGQIGDGASVALDLDGGRGPITGTNPMVFKGRRPHQNDRKGEDQPLPPQQNSYVIDYVSFLINHRLCAIFSQNVSESELGYFVSVTENRAFHYPCYGGRCRQALQFLLG